MEVLPPRPDRRPVGVVVVGHGLNQKPSSLHELVASLQDHGFSVVLLTLRGHEAEWSEPDPARSVVWNHWHEDWLRAAELATRHAAHVALPLSFVGFSLGGLLHLRSLTLAPDAFPWTRQVLLAPALAIRQTSRAVMLFSPLGDSFRLPSVAPHNIRARPGTTVAQYRALFELERDLRAAPFPDAARIPTLVLIDRADELVSPAGVRQFAQERHLDEWTFEWLAKDWRTTRSWRRHYITDAGALGPPAFDAMAHRIAGFLASDAPPHEGLAGPATEGA